MEQWSELRRRVLVEGVSRREVMRETGMHWKTLAKILSHSEPPGYRLEKARERPKLGPYLGRIEAILKEDAGMPRKQRHTAKRIWERQRELWLQQAAAVLLYLRGSATARSRT